MSAVLGPAGLRGRDPPATGSRSVFTRAGPAAGPEGAHGARPARGSGRRGFRRVPRRARHPAALPWRIKGSAVPRWRLPTASPLGPASPWRCWSILRQHQPCPGQQQARARLLPALAAPLRPGGRGRNKTRASQDPEEPFSTRGDPKEPSVPRGGLSCAAGPTQPGGRGLRSRDRPGAPRRGPRAFLWSPCVPPPSPADGKKGGLPNQIRLPLSATAPRPRARDATCSTLVARK